MMISTKGRYALRVMIELAGQPEGKLVALKEIAQRQGISEKYLEAIMKKLVEKGLVSGLRGKRGGYQLSRKPEECTVGEILRAAEDTLAPVACLGLSGEQGCPRSGQCVTLPIWKELRQLIDDFFDGITLDQLACQAQMIEGGLDAV